MSSTGFCVPIGTKVHESSGPEGLRFRVQDGRVEKRIEDKGYCRVGTGSVRRMLPRWSYPASLTLISPYGTPLFTPIFELLSPSSKTTPPTRVSTVPQRCRERKPVSSGRPSVSCLGPRLVWVRREGCVRVRTRSGVPGWSNKPFREKGQGRVRDLGVSRRSLLWVTG